MDQGKMRTLLGQLVVANEEGEIAALPRPDRQAVVFMLERIKSILKEKEANFWKPSH